MIEKMINEADRFFAPSGNIFPGGPSTWHVIDWDQRRMVSVTMEQEQESEDLAFEHLHKHIDDLPDSVYEIRISDDGELLSASTDKKDDQTRCSYYPPLDRIERAKDISVVSRSDLQELDRLGPMVDLVCQPSSSEPTIKSVFKYYFISQRLPYTWHEMNLWMRLPRHPNIVSFEQIVVDELESRLVGFTTAFVPGGTLESNKTRCFKLKWLRQLIRAVDELNLNLGIAHQDIAPRNLLIDEKSDSLLLFDFNFSARIGLPDVMPIYDPARNDIKGVFFTMYEIITRKEELRAVRHDEQDLSSIEGQEWIRHPDVVLDHTVEEYKAVLSEWREKRQTGRQVTKYTEAPNYLDWPDIPPPPLEEVHMGYVGDVRQVKMIALYDWSRTESLEKGRPVLNWQRPSARNLKPGTRIMETGQVLASKPGSGSM